MAKLAPIKKLKGKTVKSLQLEGGMPPMIQIVNKINELVEFVNKNRGNE